MKAEKTYPISFRVVEKDYLIFQGRARKQGLFKKDEPDVNKYSKKFLVKDANRKR